MLSLYLSVYLPLSLLLTLYLGKTKQEKSQLGLTELCRQKAQQSPGVVVKVGYRRISNGPGGSAPNRTHGPCHHMEAPGVVAPGIVQQSVHYCFSLFLHLKKNIAYKIGPGLISWSQIYF